MPFSPNPTFSQPTPVHVSVVRTRDRLADAAAALCLIVGVATFLFARHSLTALANGTYIVPIGVTYTSRADFHTLQSKFGLWLAAFGLAIALAAALSHSCRSKPTAASPGPRR